MRYFIYLSYDGTNYHGWQIQPNAISVQQKLNEALTTVLRRKTETTGAGRTDTGVHAEMMVAHFDIEKTIDTEKIADKLCRLLPPDIAVTKICRVKDNAHARFDALSRTYYYTIYTKKDPFLRYFATKIHFKPDFALMNEACEILLNTKDFTSFSKLGTDVKTNICDITHAKWVQISENSWRFEITANRFLRNMVRAIVGTLLDIGRHKITIKDLSDIINQKNRCAAGESAPGNALSLVNIQYPQDIFIANFEQNE